MEKIAVLSYDFNRNNNSSSFKKKIFNRKNKENKKKEKKKKQEDPIILFGNWNFFEHLYHLKKKTKQKKIKMQAFNWVYILTDINVLKGVEVLFY